MCPCNLQIWLLCQHGTHHEDTGSVLPSHPSCCPHSPTPPLTPLLPSSPTPPPPCLWPALHLSVETHAALAEAVRIHHARSSCCPPGALKSLDPLIISALFWADRPHAPLLPRSDPPMLGAPPPPPGSPPPPLFSCLSSLLQVTVAVNVLKCIPGTFS